MGQSGRSRPGAADHLTSAEREQLEAGVVRLEEWGSQLLVPFKVRRLRFAAVLWINRRWFLERQFDLADESTIQRVHDWLLGEFAYAVPQSSDLTTSFTEDTQTFHSDRYGNSSGRGPHGGSGRVATLGAMQVKGVGVTPLVGVGGDTGHSHGCCSVDEAIREAIYAEIAAAEFPHSAVPIVAILATNLTFTDQCRVQRRALIVRPAVLRVAHLERAPMFRQSAMGYHNSQTDDVARTRNVVQRWLSNRSVDVYELVGRIAEQVAFGQVHRIFNGGYFSSNLTLDGAILDYGGMRALSNWAGARNMDGVVGFGREMKIVNKVIESVAFYLNKYRPNHAGTKHSAAALRKRAEEAHARAFKRECLRIWNFNEDSTDDVVTAVVRILRDYYSRQQNHQINYKHGETNGLPWLHDESHFGLESVALASISVALRRHFGESEDGLARRWQAWLTADRFLMPRKGLDRESLIASIGEMLAISHSESDLPRLIASFILTTISDGRRHWPKLPTELSVLSQVSYEGSTALLVQAPITKNQFYWLEGVHVRGRYVIFGSKLPESFSSRVGGQVSNACWTALVAADDLEDAVKTKLPKMEMQYGRHAAFARFARDYQA